MSHALHPALEMIDRSRVTGPLIWPTLLANEEDLDANDFDRTRIVP